MPIDHASNSSWEDEQSDMPVAIGDVLDGKYRIVRVLGKGGMGVVVAAVHVELGHRIALKFLSRAGARNEETLARFALEAKAAAMMRTEHATRILDIGRLPSGEPYMVLELLEGCDLGALVTRRGPLPIVDAVTYVLEACEAIAEAHSLGIVHRDLKPDNLFLVTRPDGTQIVKVLDFGISKFSSLAQDKDAPALTTTSAIIGSPMYMSPEQLKSTRDVDHRTDIWSIAVTLYELISGQLPFPWRSMAELSAAILKDPPVPLSSRVRAVPAELDQIISRCLEKNPGDRFDNIAELAWALAPFGGPLAVRSAERASELLARAPVVPSKRSGSRLSKRNQLEPKNDVAIVPSGRVKASPMAPTRPAGGTSTTKPFQPMLDAFPSPALRGLPIAAIFLGMLVAVGSSLYVRPWLRSSTHVLEAHRGIANAMAIVPVVPRDTAARGSSVSGAAETPLAPKTNSNKPPTPRFNREPSEVVSPGPAQAPRPNPFDDRE